MLKEQLPLQVDMFTGEKVDTRTDSQKRRDRERTLPQQQLMFRGAEVFEFGGKPRSMYQDWLDVATPSPLDLQFQDTRSPEEIEQDERRAAQDNMKPLFSMPEIEENVEAKADTPSGIIFDREKYSTIKGLRAKIRAHRVSTLVRPS